MSLIKVQTMKQNTGNWRHDIESIVEYVNYKYIKRIMPNGEAFSIYLEGDDQQYPSMVINKSSLDLILGASNE